MKISFMWFLCFFFPLCLFEISAFLNLKTLCVCVCVCVYVCMCVYTCHGACEEVRGQLVGVFSFHHVGSSNSDRVPRQSLLANFLLSSRVMRNSQNCSHRCETFTHFRSLPQKPQRRNRRGSSFLFSYHSEVLDRKSVV